MKRLGIFVSQHRSAVLLGLILIMAIGFRFWQLDSLPPGLHPDEAANGLDIFRIQDGDIRPLYNTNGPRESLFFFLQGIFVTLLGNSILALRLAPAIIGTLAVLFTYLWTKEWFSKRTGLLAAFIMASAPWAVTMSRIGFRASMVPLLLASTVWLFTKAYKERRWYWYVLSGLSLGAGFYTYISYRMVPFIILTLFGFVLWRQRRELFSSIKPLLVTGLVTAVVLVPLGLYTLQNPADVIGGRSSVSFTNPELNDGEPLQTLLDTIGKTALMFNFNGDPNYRHNLGGEPMLDAFIGVMFVLGLLLCLRRIFDLRHFTLLVIFGAMLVPEILTAEGIPHALRAIGVIPVIYIMAALGIVELLERWRAIFPRNPVAQGTATILLGSLLLLSTVYNYQRYFVAWANDPKTYEAYSEDVVALAEYLNQQPYEGKRYVVVDGYSNITLLYLTKEKANYERLEGDRLLDVQLTEPTQFVVAESQRAAVARHLETLPLRLVSTGESEHRHGVLLYTVYEATGEPNEQN